MAAKHSDSVATLRAASLRISSTPAKELPSSTPQISGLIWNCRDLLSTPTETKQNSETSVLVHRFKTHLSTLLQDRTIEGRWAAVVLVKSAIEAGGIEVLSKCNAWVKSLLGILKKPDPPTTRILTVLTLTRIFMLTWDYSNLVREITTPALTAFVPTCLSNIENKRCSARELESVLEAFAVLLPRHPTIFRTNEAKLRAYLSNVLSSSSGGFESGQLYSESCRSTASHLLAQLHTCAPKQGSSEKWAETLKGVVTAAHATCDRIFRAVDEDWQSVAGVERSAPLTSYNGDVVSEKDDGAGMRPWKGIYAGGERLVSLLEVIESHFTTASSGVVSVRIGGITDLLTRLFAVTQPHGGNQEFIKINNQVSKDEREALFAVLPRVHVAAMRLCETIIHRFGGEVIAWVHWLVEHISWVFKAERQTTEIRMASYRLLRDAITIIGPTMAKAEVVELNAILEQCCEDVLPAENTTTSTGMQNGGCIKQQLGFAGSKATQSHPTDGTDIRQAAEHLLCTVLDRIEAACLPPKLRAQIDRIAVLSHSETTLFASVMNPHRKQNDARIQPSLLPILAREFGQQPHVEALLRPRMPPVRGKAGTISEENDDADEQEDVHVHNEYLPDAENIGTAADEPPSNTTTLSQDEDAAIPRYPADPDASAPLSSKRPAGETPELSLSAKRVPVVTATISGEDVVNVVQPEVVANNTTGTATAGAMDIGSDDSDFEMPPLTMEPDTDPEDEEEDDES
ncbi:hypothetical protein M409DRAFT_37259 [Zasmidium cellare ATCC 36951]|uniref:Pre-rRNA-processing protein RIX1 n=1 Tax=Zasmidium cellare ATCC 36951 TaxID=1080233 RepID=A0A6A6C9H7_ZASCE|nr:uncharacterized protein M409DRAFT_37259 [Zasmidium cellare ATCC 36951]KAF2163473.1 hypothetical protein M409DRAFT_37259 [Zasmidium cellare ATCC 36951]